jgi:prevent-host-death family protein
MCVMMTEKTSPQDKVGVRELRQNLSVYLRRVVAGESLTVTDRGNVVAMLVPLPDPDTALARMVASGRVARPAGDLTDLKLPEGSESTTLSQALQAEREERL